tara:strand:- start:460 stop:624 length:165 start_codon:yes stop_codon:yes gene_type:complete
MNKRDKRRLKLTFKAGTCISREKAQKILKKWQKSENPIHADGRTPKNPLGGRKN